MVEAILANTPLYLMIFARLAGMIGMNPLLARKNVPSSVRVALIMLMTVLLASAGTVFALRRRSDHDSCSLPTGKGQEDNESSYR